MPDYSFGERLKELRQGRGLTQQQLAEAASVSQNAISHWESGDREPSWSAVRAIAKALGVDCTAFDVGGVDMKGQAEGSKNQPPAPKRRGKK